MRVTLLHNPTAGDEEHGVDSLMAAIAAAGHEVTARSMKADWEETLRGPADLVVAAGGDGTVRRVFRALAGSSVLATLFPVGSANNIARSLGFAPEDDPAELAADWEEGELRSFDIGALGGARFAESAGGGIFADVLARDEESEADPGGEDKVGHGLRLLRAVVEEAPVRQWQVAVDGEDHSGELLALTAMNVHETGANIPLAPGADPCDGLLDIVFVRPEHRSALSAYVQRRLDGADPEPLTLEVLRGRRLELSPPQDARLHVDSELVPRTDGAEVCLTSSVTVLVPRR